MLVLLKSFFDYILVLLTNVLQYQWDSTGLTLYSSKHETAQPTIGITLDVITKIRTCLHKLPLFVAGWTFHWVRSSMIIKIKPQTYSHKQKLT